MKPRKREEPERGGGTSWLWVSTGKMLHQTLRKNGPGGQGGLVKTGTHVYVDFNINVNVNVRLNTR